MARVKDKITDNDYDNIDTYYGIETTVPTDRMQLYKSTPIVRLPKEKLTFMELKLFDIYLGRINPQNPSVTKVVFTKDELCKVLGTNRINNSHLMKCLDALMSTIITVASTNKGKSQIEKFTLLSHAKLSYDNEHFNGVPTIELECTQAAKSYIYNIETVGFLKANLKTLLQFKSKNAYALYQYLKQVSERRLHSSNPEVRMNQKWTVNIDEFKTYLGVGNKYSDVKDLEKWVLLPALKEIEENTDLRFDYKKIKIGRRIQKIEFEIFEYGYDALPDSKDTEDDKDWTNHLDEWDDPEEAPSHAFYDEEDGKWKVPFN